MASKLGDSDMNELKGKVLIGRVDYLSDELGDPARYFPALRAKGVLFPEDCERIKAKVTAREKVYEMIELIHTRHSEKDGHAMDVLMEALRKQRVQAHIARELQRALARAKDQRRGDGTPSPMSPHSDPSAIPTFRQNSLASVSTPGSTLTTPASFAGSSLASSPQHKFDMHPQFGALPPGRPAKTLPLPAQPSPDLDPVFGVRPGTPPNRRGAFRPAQEAGTPGIGEVATGLSGHYTSSASDSLNTAATDSSFSPPYQNGESEGGPSGMDRRYSDLSYTTTSVYSTTSTEQSGLDYSRGHKEYMGGNNKLQELEAKCIDLQTMYDKKEQEVMQLKRDNMRLKEKYREMEDHNMDLKKQYEQLREKMRNITITEQKHILDSYRPERTGGPDEVTQLRHQLEEKGRQMAVLEKQVEQYQQDNQQLQLSLSSNSARPHHLPIGSPMGRPVIHRPQYNPARSPYQGGTGNPMNLSGPATAAGITPMKSMRVGDSLNQHNIHLQQSRGTGPRRESPAFSPAKDSGKVPALFSPGRDGVAKGPLFSPGSGKRLSSGSGDTPMGETYYQSSNSSLNSSGSKGSAGVTLQTTPNAEHSTMV